MNIDFLTLFTKHFNVHNIIFFFAFLYYTVLLICLCVPILS